QPRKAAIMLWAALALVTSVDCARRTTVLGRDIDVDKVRQVTPRVTTESQVEQWFGPPDLVETKPDGSKDYLYKYNGYVETGADLLVVAWKDRKPEEKKLRISVRNGIVTGLRYTNSAARSEDVTK
ncbi:MAG: hypothetical protein ACREQQ_19065, partial [Candidatus Binatia bacterium]